MVKITNIKELKCFLFGHQWEITTEVDTMHFTQIDYRSRYYKCSRCGEIKKIKEK